MEPAVFVTELRHRLLVADAAEDTWCPKCDGVLDRHSLHAGSCVAGGERTLRHNAVRNLVCSWAERGVLQPERERAGLLLPQRPDEAALARRRPADVFLPAFRGTPTALDFAVTVSGWSPSRRRGEKRQRLRLRMLQSRRRTWGLRMTALVRVSSSSPWCSRAAWDKQAARVLWDIARAVATREGEGAETLHGYLLQRALHCGQEPPCPSRVAPPGLGDWAVWKSCLAFAPVGLYEPLHAWSSHRPQKPGWLRMLACTSPLQQEPSLLMLLPRAAAGCVPRRVEEMVPAEPQGDLMRSNTRLFPELGLYDSSARLPQLVALFRGQKAEIHNDQWNEPAILYCQSRR
ncbi:nipblb [Symbiodinium natans]|uniref:Nipblb protein n=1 Tax=Symbiodinium natans TaxID=878477 RepID=A0A812LMP0_9DINO|nr:nipblb [Symbiodinium natans]CAE7246839.1 nipblb [Symbiodinium natans]